jgi:hypothetical protein
MESYSLFPTPYILSLCNDIDKVWIGTNEGIIVYNKETKERETYTSKNSPLPSDEITGVIEDEGRLWFTLIGGIARLSYEKGFSFYKDIPITGNEISGNLEIPLKDPGKYYIDSILSGIQELGRKRSKIYVYPCDCKIKENPQITQRGTQTIADLPMASALFQSFPNPANNYCFIPFNLSNDADVSLEIYNILGQKVKTIEVGQRKAGSYTQKDRAIFWDLKNDNEQSVSKGLYFYQLKAGDFKATKAMVVK